MFKLSFLVFFWEFICLFSFSFLSNDQLDNAETKIGWDGRKTCLHTKKLTYKTSIVVSECEKDVTQNSIPSDFEKGQVGWDMGEMHKR